MKQFIYLNRRKYVIIKLDNNNTFVYPYPKVPKYSLFFTVTFCLFSRLIKKKKNITNFEDTVS